MVTQEYMTAYYRVCREARPKKIKTYKDYRRQLWEETHRESRRKRRRELYHQDIEKSRQRQKEYRQRHKERLRQYWNQWDRTHKESRRKSRKERYYRDIEKTHQRIKENYWKSREKRLLSTKKSRWKQRIIVLAYYSDNKMECACCGEDNILFLTLDHVNGGGTKQRKQYREFNRWLINHGFPEGYQVLCWNCNCAKGKYGYCPHEKMGEKVWKKNSKPYPLLKS